ncbi:patatin-like phospholipase family protein [Methylobacterium nodulans]|uniref:Patatin n=1 Tax=Methylobacterium nodulans (strain LMG 21967 / CNCM I-2342 / ORS 2060) TaxID=460265 RepID=B8IVS6_METNO|nr:patatin-like phospholipase family protein [Methylobacterium nodulans]ACL62516.1 Patatin [Methylobacterium nodulans ORS 2060]
MAKDPIGEAKPNCVLVLQGGGALGAYHIGAYQALSEGGFEPDWFSGISIGAINAAVLAGNQPADRLAKLEALWHAISWPEVLVPLKQLPLEIWHNNLSNAAALMFGQPAFFTPRPVSPFVAPPGNPSTVSFYDTAPLRETLRDLADFDLINSAKVRLTLGATDVATGDMVFFDNTKEGPFGPEHVMASGSLPPGFPATKVGDRYYWDGGCVSNTPLEAILEDQPKGHTVVFMIDLWGAAGQLPGTINDVFWRAKQIQYASRTWTQVDAVASKVNLRHAVRLLRKQSIAEVDKAVPDDLYIDETRRLDIVHITYQPGKDQIPNSDAEFSRSSIAERRAAGYADMRSALEAQPWKHVEKPAHLAAIVHRVRHGKVMTDTEPNLHGAEIGAQVTPARKVANE